MPYKRCGIFNVFNSGFVSEADKCSIGTPVYNCGLFGRKSQVDCAADESKARVPTHQALAAKAAADPNAVRIDAPVPPVRPQSGGQRCSQMNKTCSDGVLCSAMNTLCLGAKAECSGMNSECPDGVLCSAMNSKCGGTASECSGMNSVCSDGVLCSGMRSQCLKGSAKCTGAYSECGPESECVSSKDSYFMKCGKNSVCKGTAYICDDTAKFVYDDETQVRTQCTGRRVTVDTPTGSTTFTCSPGSSYVIPKEWANRPTGNYVGLSGSQTGQKYAASGAQHYHKKYSTTRTIASPQEVESTDEFGDCGAQTWLSNGAFMCKNSDGSVQKFTCPVGQTCTWKGNLISNGGVQNLSGFIFNA